MNHTAVPKCAHAHNAKKLFLFALSFAMFATKSHAQSMTAADLENLCTSKSESEQVACTLMIKAYMDGFIEGVAKGAIDTYKYDPQVRDLVKDIKMKDFAPRLSKVVEASTCIQRVSVAEMTKSFVGHVRANPSLRLEGYRKTLTRAIQSKYCGQ